MKRLIAVTTCKTRRHQADAQRNTWALGRDDVRFFVGENPDQDEVGLSVDDSYAGLPAKVRAACRWALDQGYDSVLKLDDDVYLVPGRLPGYDAYDYVGNFRMRNGDYPYDYASGFAYHLGRRAMEIVAGCALGADTMEDRFFGNLLGASRNIKTFDEKMFACSYPCGIDEPKFLWGSPLGKMCIAIAQYPADKFEGLHYWFKRTFTNVHGI